MRVEEHVQSVVIFIETQASWVSRGELFWKFRHRGRQNIFIAHPQHRSITRKLGTEILVLLQIAEATSKTLALEVQVDIIGYFGQQTTKEIYQADETA